MVNNQNLMESDQNQIMELYGFSGKMGSGKNYVAEKLFWPKLPIKNTLVMAFSDHFKVDACVKNGLEYSKVFGEKDEETRIILQKMGTEEGRMRYGNNIWIDILDTWIKIYQERGIERIIIVDVRFPNEVEYIKNNGGKVIRIHSPKRNKKRLDYESKGNEERLEVINKHVSEISLDEYNNFDWLIMNDPDQKTEEQIDRFISNLHHRGL